MRRTFCWYHWATGIYRERRNQAYTGARAYTLCGRTLGLYWWALSIHRRTHCLLIKTYCRVCGTYSPHRTLRSRSPIRTLSNSTRIRTRCRPHIRTLSCFRTYRRLSSTFGRWCWALCRLNRALSLHRGTYRPLISTFGHCFWALCRLNRALSLPSRTFCPYCWTPSLRGRTFSR